MAVLFENIYIKNQWFIMFSKFIILYYSIFMCVLINILFLIYVCLKFNIFTLKYIIIT